MYNLSVVIPIYNTRQYLDICVRSVLAQTIKDIEIILVDDESPDNAGDRCDEFAREYENIKVVHKKNSGLGYARNSGLEIAQGKYVTFLDSDDYIEDSYYYEKMVNECDESDADICISKGFYNFRGDKLNKMIYLNNNEIGMKESEDIIPLIPRLISRKPNKDDGLYGSACFSIYKRDLLKDNNIKFVSERDFMSEDIWFNMDVYNVAQRVVLSDAIGYCYRYNETSLSRGYRANRFDQLTCTIKQLTERCCQMELMDYEERVAFFYWVNFEKCINQEVRYVDKLSGIRHIEEMMMNSECKRNLQVLLNNREFKGLQRLLCILLKNGCYYSVYSMLTIYNRIKHKRMRLP